MSVNDDKTSIRRRRRDLTVSSSDFVRFLETKTPDLTCPACGTDEWTVICEPEAPEETLNTYRIVVPLRDGSNPIALSSFAIHCDNCGYLRQHVSKVVKTWVTKNPVVSEDDSEQLELPDLDDLNVD